MRVTEDQFSDAQTLAMPISAITDGWVLDNGDLHLEVRMKPGQIRYISIPRYLKAGKRKTSRWPRDWKWGTTT